MRILQRGARLLTLPGFRPRMATPAAGTGAKRIGDGAEAVVMLDRGVVIKDRVGKRYRLPEIDGRLRKARTRQEASILLRLQALGFPSPRVLEMDDRGMLLRMEFVDGPQLKSVLDSSPLRDALAREVGTLVGTLHSQDIIHGDLTTSNMILSKGKVVLIDFGLGFFSTKTEDKAVDLHLLRRALGSKHPLVAERFFAIALEGYAAAMGECAGEVLSRLESVERRGRYQKPGKKGAACEADGEGSLF